MDNLILTMTTEIVVTQEDVDDMRGARPWHPLLQALRKELEG